MQGVGKSMIMNLFAQSKANPDLCSQILHSHEIPSDTETNDVTNIENKTENLNLTNTEVNDEQSKNNLFKFKMQDMHHIERGIHCTKGINISYFYSLFLFLGDKLMA